MPSLAVDSIAPAFELKDQHGELVSLSSLADKWVVLYFYPKDDTPGCTKEACNFRDNHAALQALGAVVLGVSADSAAAHAKFAAKYELPFQLLVDNSDHEGPAHTALSDQRACTAAPTKACTERPS